MDGLCFVPENGALKLIIAWLSDILGKGKKRGNHKTTSCPKERIQGASSLYVKACCFNYYCSQMSPFSTAEPPQKFRDYIHL